MDFKQRLKCRKRQGTVLVLSMIFLLVFSALSVSLSALTNTNAQIAHNHQKINHALAAAQSGIECAKYIAGSITLPKTSSNFVSNAEADQIWTTLQTYLQAQNLDSVNLTGPYRFTDGNGNGDRMALVNMQLESGGTPFTLSFSRYDGYPQAVKVKSIGVDGQISRSISVDLNLAKDSEVLNYAIASRGRMWLTGDTTIHGNVYSSWDRADIAPFNMTNDSRIEGTANTVLSLDQIQTQNAFQLESLTSDDTPIFAYGQCVYDAEGNPVSGNYGTLDNSNYMVDLNGNPVFDADGNPIVRDFVNRYIDSSDELQGYHEGVGYGVNAGENEMPGMDISDYDTSLYHNRTISNTLGIPTTTTTQLVNIGTRRNPNYVEQEVTVEKTVTEYFPHGSDGYDDYKSGSVTLKRYVYENEVFTDTYLPSNRNALFENCTFEGVLYIDCANTTSSYFNNVRFNDCTFNGVIVTNTPSNLKWQYNALYFTGEANFNNQSDIQEATILAPHFNVDLGNTNPESNDNNILKGAIVGGIVDVRGNAQIEGTIISMCDTTQWSSGYVTNIGATLNDGGSETTQLGDVGVIRITPEEERMLPSGITSPIVMKPQFNTYQENI